MYAGSTITKYSGRVMGAHQKIDRLARHHLNQLISEPSLFPGIKTILLFEGQNGPDGIKRKSPAQDEPWHYFNPFDDEDSELLDQIKSHYAMLVGELKKENIERAAFEAAWLAHAIVDGLTPAHHYPYERELEEIRGEGKETRTTVHDKIVMPGSTKREKLKNNWKFWGPSGLMTTHAMFEFGVASIIAPLRLGDVVPKEYDVNEIMKIGLPAKFQQTAREIAVYEMFDAFQKKGWTPKLAYQVRHILAPAIVQTVTLGWYASLGDADLL